MEHSSWYALVYQTGAVLNYKTVALVCGAGFVQQVSNSFEHEFRCINLVILATSLLCMVCTIS